MEMDQLIFFAICVGIYLYIKKLRKEASDTESSYSSSSNGRSVSDEIPTPTSPRTNPTRPRTNPTRELNIVDEKSFGTILWLAAGAAYSGEYTPGKGLIIQKWIKKERDKLSDNKSLAFKSIAKMIMAVPSQTLITSRVPSEYSGTLKSISKRIQLDAYNLIVEIIAVDEQLTKQELVHLKKVEECLNLDHETFEEVKQKYFFGLVVNSDVSDREILTLLNVHDEWPKEKKLEYLAKQFITWNSRSQGGPPGRRKAAIQRLSLIGRARTMVQSA